MILVQNLQSDGPVCNIILMTAHRRIKYPDIFHAARANDPEELLVALRKGHRLDVKRGGETPLHAAANSSSEAFIRVALEHDSADVWALDSLNKRAYDYARDRNDFEIMRLLNDAMYPGGQVPLSPPEPDEP